ncbi:hypothetical protein PVAND_015708 [Polypedilum vanderplanki]|uniref:Uncharacterized protein n=1 Tax=Polypedilum vanderplanki TaxID=319348 RepID=A0A9J6BDF6_POLVA|nr:hypothetical protein PVAND_015708 [Polypedilum vanderplanki]
MKLSILLIFTVTCAVIYAAPPANNVSTKPPATADPKKSTAKPQTGNPTKSQSVSSEPPKNQNGQQNQNNKTQTPPKGVGATTKSPSSSGDQKSQNKQPQNGQQPSTGKTQSTPSKNVQRRQNNNAPAAENNIRPTFTGSKGTRTTVKGQTKRSGRKHGTRVTSGYAHSARKGDKRQSPS